LHTNIPTCCGTVGADVTGVLRGSRAAIIIKDFAHKCARVRLRFDQREFCYFVGTPITGGDIISDSDPIGAKGAGVLRR
jgi:hypothetical protein